MKSKALFVGDSQTFYLSDSSDVYLYCNHLNNTSEEIFPSGTVGKYYNAEYDCFFSWKLGQSAYSLNEEILKNLIGINNADIIPVLLFGTVDIRYGIAEYNNPEEVAIKYVSTLNNFFQDNYNYYVGMPISNEGADEHFTVFDNTLANLLGNKYIRYPDWVVSRKYQSSDSLNHINFEDSKKIVNFLLEKIKH